MLMLVRGAALAVALVVVVAAAALIYLSSIPSPWPSLGRPSLATQTFDDAVGDAPAGDLVAVRTMATTDNVIIELEFATANDRAEPWVDVMIAEPGGQGTPSCNGSSPYLVQIEPDPLSASLVNTTDREVAAVEATVDGQRVSIAVPLWQIGDPIRLHFAVAAWSSPDRSGEVADRSPDTPDTCNAASLRP